MKIVLFSLLSGFLFFLQAEKVTVEYNEVLNYKNEYNLYIKKVCIEGYNYLISTSDKGVSVVQMREINSSGVEELTKCKHENIK